MDCIPYINDLQIEINILKDVNQNNNKDIQKKIEEKEKLIEKCKDNLEKLSDNKICYRIYRYMLAGLNPSKAVEKVAEENYFNNVKPNSTKIIWTNYYRKVKDILLVSEK